MDEQVLRLDVSVDDIQIVAVAYGPQQLENVLSHHLLLQTSQSTSDSIQNSE